MNVCMLTQTFPRWKNDVFGRFIYILARGLIKTGRINISVIAPHEKGSAIEDTLDGIRISRFRYAPVRYERIAYKGEMAELVRENYFNKLLFSTFLGAFFYKLLFKCSKKNFDIIHAHWLFPAGLIALIISKLFKIPYVVTCHGTDIRLLVENNFIIKRLGKYITGNAGIVITVSSHLREKLVKLYPESEQKITVIPMPVDAEKIFPAIDKVSSEIVILCVARLNRQKRIDTLIQAASLLKGKSIKFELFIVGEGSEKSNLENLIRDLSLEEEAHLLGSKKAEEVNELYNMSDVVVLPSEDEGFGLVLVEAMLCGKPVIGSDSGGIKDIIKNGENGFLFRLGDSEDLALKLITLCNDNSLRRKMGVKGQMLASKYSDENIARQYKEIYSGLF